MNYLKAYISLVRKSLAEKRTLNADIERYEHHHIFPVSIFGKNNKTVLLTFREHFIAHRLLAKIYENRYGFDDIRTRKMNMAIHRMTYSSKDKMPKISSRLYETARISCINAKKGRRRLDMYGKKYFGASEETILKIKKKISENRRGKHINYPKNRKPLSNRTPEVFKKISETRKETKTKFKNMREEEFRKWISKQNLFTKRNTPNSNVTRVLKYRNIAFSVYYAESDFSKSWMSINENRKLFYGN